MPAHAQAQAQLRQQDVAVRQPVGAAHGAQGAALSPRAHTAAPAAPTTPAAVVQLPLAAASPSEQATASRTTATRALHPSLSGEPGLPYGPHAIPAAAPVRSPRLHLAPIQHQAVAGPHARPPPVPASVLQLDTEQVHASLSSGNLALQSAALLRLKRGMQAILEAGGWSGEEAFDLVASKLAPMSYNACCDFLVRSYSDAVALAGRGQLAHAVDKLQNGLM